MSLLPGIVIKKEGWPVVSNPQAIDFRNRTLFDVLSTLSLDSAVEVSKTSITQGAGGGGAMGGSIYYLDHAPASPGDNHNDGDYTYDTSQKPYKVYRQVNGRWVQFPVRGFETTYMNRDPVDGDDNGNEGDFWINSVTMEMFVQMDAVWNTIIGDLWEGSSSGIATPAPLQFTRSTSKILVRNSDDSIYSSDDTGLSWTEVLTIPDSIYSICVCASNRLIVGVPGGILYSDDYVNFTYLPITFTGLSIGHIIALLYDGTYVYAVADQATRSDEDPEEPQQVATEELVYRSDDNGETWEQYHTGIPNPNAPTSICIANGNIFLSRSAYGDGDILRLIAGTWTPCTVNGDTFGTSLSSVIYHDEYYWAGAIANNFGSSGVYRSADGDTWTAHSLGTFSVLAMAVINNIMLAGLYSNGVYKSVDDGDNWTDDSPNIAPSIGQDGADVYAFSRADDGYQMLCGALAENNIYRKSYPV